MTALTKWNDSICRNNVMVCVSTYERIEKRFPTAAELCEMTGLRSVLLMHLIIRRLQREGLAVGLRTAARHSFRSMFFIPRLMTAGE